MNIQVLPPPLKKAQSEANSLNPKVANEMKQIGTTYYKHANICRTSNEQKGSLLHTIGLQFYMLEKHNLIVESALQWVPQF